MAGVKNDKLMKNVKHALAAALMAALVVAGCSKEAIDTVNDHPSGGLEGFTEYIIPAGGQYSNNSGTESISTSLYKFQVYFDSTAIYTIPDADKDDINKLSGFADNGDVHLQFSARVGWRWSDRWTARTSSGLASRTRSRRNRAASFRVLPTMPSSNMATTRAA